MFPNSSNNSWISDQTGNSPQLHSHEVPSSFMHGLPSSTTSSTGPLKREAVILQKLIEDTRILFDNILKTSQQTSEMMKQNGVNWKNPALYKTSICDSWKNSIPCKYGKKCWYAHGRDELRYVPRLDLIPPLLESLQTFQTELKQLVPSVDKVPLDFFRNVPPPNYKGHPLMSCQQAAIGDRTVQPTQPNDMAMIKNALGIDLASMAASPRSDYFCDGYNGPVTSDVNNSDASSLKLPDFSDDYQLFRNHWNGLVERTNGCAISENVRNNDVNAGRQMFTNGFQLFGQDYPLHKN